MADARSQYPAYGLLFADKASVKGVINMDLAYYKGMFTGLKDVMQAIGADWKIADPAPSMTALDSIRGSMLGMYEELARKATSVPTIHGRIRGCMWKHAHIRLNFTSWTPPPP